MGQQIRIFEDGVFSFVPLEVHEVSWDVLKLTHYRFVTPGGKLFVSPDFFPAEIESSLGCDSFCAFLRDFQDALGLMLTVPAYWHKPGETLEVLYPIARQLSLVLKRLEAESQKEKKYVKR
jgi:hypothetical protein